MAGKLIKIVLLSTILIMGMQLTNSFSDLSNGERNIYYSGYNEDLFVRYVDVPMIAVHLEPNAGILGRVRIGLIENGKGKIIFDDRAVIDESTIEGIISSVEFAEEFTKVKKYDYFITYDLLTESVSGHSSGAGIAIGLVALLNDVSLKEKVIITGGIDKTGELKETGGIWLKSYTAAEQGIDTLYVPVGQSKLTYYVDKGGYYLSQELDLNEQWKDNGLKVIEVRNIKEIISEILEKPA